MRTLINLINQQASSTTSNTTETGALPYETLFNRFDRVNLKITKHKQYGLLALWRHLVPHLPPTPQNAHLYGCKVTKEMQQTSERRKKVITLALSLHELSQLSVRQRQARPQVAQVCQCCRCRTLPRQLRDNPPRRELGACQTQTKP